MTDLRALLATSCLIAAAACSAPPPETGEAPRGVPGAAEAAPDADLAADPAIVLAQAQAAADRAAADVVAAAPPTVALAGAATACAQALQTQEFPDPLARSEAFLSCTGAADGVITTASGLQYEVLAEGVGDVSPDPRDFVCVHYRGDLITGAEFDSSYGRGAPAQFPAGGLIRGWVEALGDMTAGERRRLYIHPDLAYGLRGSPPVIGPQEALVFDMTLLEVRQSPGPGC